MFLEMKVKGLALDPLSNMPMIILRDEEEKRSLPIWVGLFEANAIALELEKISTPRPMTHDLIKNILESLDARVQKVVVNDLRENTFYAVLYLRLGSADITVDSRPSDAIALALRVGAPFFFRYPSIPAPTYPGFSLPLPVSRRLRRVARALDLDLVHVHHPFLLGVTGRRLARGQRRPLVFTYHTRYEKYAHYVPLPQRLVRSLAVRLACRFADRADLVVAPSDHVADTLRSRGVRAPVTVIPTGVDLALFSPGS